MNSSHTAPTAAPSRSSLSTNSVTPGDRVDFDASGLPVVTRVVGDYWTPRVPLARSPLSAGGVPSNQAGSTALSSSMSRGRMRSRLFGAVIRSRLLQGKSRGPLQSARRHEI